MPTHPKKSKKKGEGVGGSNDHPMSKIYYQVTLLKIRRFILSTYFIQANIMSSMPVITGGVNVLYIQYSIKRVLKLTD